MRRFTFLVFIVVAGLLLSGCAPGPNIVPISDTAEPAGFLLGIWHGLIVLITFVVSLFTEEVNIYEVQNTGIWYNVGFIIGLIISLGGSGKSTSRRARAD
ncbi:MAG: hypothetical protein HKN13_04410 [Rhodothermales bacterium]|nr:hypothetical protein [Rhodothermales bacterium]